MRVEKIGLATLYLGDCREIAPGLDRPAAVISDPPYGLGDKWVRAGDGHWPLRDRDLKDGGWDKRRCEFVSALLDMADVCVIWGGQYYNLPASRGWLAWDKIQRGFSTGDLELAWTNINAPVRAFNIGTGQFVNSEHGKEHPTQKPVPLMRGAAIAPIGEEGVPLHHIEFDVDAHLAQILLQELVHRQRLHLAGA